MRTQSYLGGTSISLLLRNNHPAFEEVIPQQREELKTAKVEDLLREMEQKER
jgi:hypothetical protein